MPRVVFTQNLRRHIDCPECEVAGGTVREALEAAFADNPLLRGYVLDDQGALRRHMGIIVDGEALKDRNRLSDPVSSHGTIHVLQALSGG